MNTNSSHELKSLQTKRNEAEALLINAKAKSTDAQQQIGELPLP
jgi:hypothetical protein